MMAGRAEELIGDPKTVSAAAASLAADVVAALRTIGSAAPIPPHDGE